MWNFRCWLALVIAILSSFCAVNANALQGHSEVVPCSTNAECLRMGLPLLKPTRRYSRNRALRPRQSNLPTVYTGAIKILDANSNPLGYVSRTLNAYNAYDITTDFNNALVVSFGPSDNGPVLFTASAGTRTGSFSYYGAQFNGQAANANMGTTGRTALTTYATLVGATAEVKGKAQNQVTSRNPNGNGAVETDIFLYDPSTTQITAKWTNTDGTLKDTVFYLGQNGYGLGLISETNYAAFKANYNVANAQQVTYYLVPPPAN
ncbi:hypothetical protein I302_108791 [Kwoniella bestiolae CBS 10118]|uniref:Uncharacterized protein n=1 Tax=Kwoniella bestiolae CBS 10118 TaxID=1296100 RepID=A0A1B9FU29_9TREE|nr:hypothetical protein I302_07928 [Kwoniella bestiolae CBS 10118]OCF22283.1 hypothetical protein I302_07928 [Kwoniella bestiolae CBS 10118]